MSEQPSRQTLDQIPSRVLTFLLGVAKYPIARAALAAKGYTQAEHDQAWSLLKKLGTLPSTPSSDALALDKDVRDAVVELDAWDEPNFAILRAALQRKHPAFVADLFADLEPKQGAEAVIGVSTLLDRIDKLAKDPSLEAQAAVKTLESRGYDKAERHRLRELVKKTKAFTAGTPADETQRLSVLTELYAWHGDWSTTARSVVTRRAHQIALGLASKRKPAKKPATPGSSEAGPTT